MSSAPFVVPAARRPGVTTRRLAGLVALLFAATSLATLAAPAPAAAWDAGTFSSQSEQDLITLTNRARASHGLRALKTDSALTKIARWRSKDMINRDYFSHTIPGYGNVFDKLSNTGYCFKVAGENIGWNTYPDDVATAAIQKMFMDSSGHRANILGKSWDVIGVGAYKSSSGKKMWTVLFADKCGTTQAHPQAHAEADRQAHPQAHAEADGQTPQAASHPASPRRSPPRRRPRSRPPSRRPKPRPPRRRSRPRPRHRRRRSWPNRPIRGGNGQGGDQGNGGSPGDRTPPGPGEAGGGGDTTTASAAGATGLRVLAPAASTGLLETIVGGVTGLFFGA